ncbi:restriction endonuclease subunit S [Proteus sp. ZN5]|uniref:restriction endonuclease subunit S n=1 Tax=Proteus sp. ZN5 TaxID=2697019 RepID=UPI0013E16A73|nr:restriction endonuclease subunit S [Proteus sp. ZN5]QIG03914.1 restriction endonuclease subunit S [Proteus sp. ZN5]
MNQLSYLEKLLDGVEVEWKPLDDVCDFKNGFAFKSNLFKEAGLPIIRITNIDGFNVILDNVKYFSPNDYKEDISSFEVSIGDILIAMSGATTGKVGIYKSEKKCYLNQRVGKFIPKDNILNKKFLYHFLLLNTKSIYILAGGGAQPNLSSNALMSKLLIPIPCPNNPEKSLAIQSEIVRILDKFTALTAELTAELTTRKKQYNYYRDQLLSFDEGKVEWKMLGEITDINTGSKPTELINTLTDFDYINAGTSRSGYSKKSNCEGDTVTTPSRGQGGIGYVGYQRKPFWLGPLCYKLQSIDNRVLLNKYLFYFLQSKSCLLLDLKKEGGVPAVNKSDLIKLEIPLPSLVKQQKIVKYLDKFDALTNSISEGLPREIELRQKQYEYYRDLLFNFPKPKPVTN